VAPFGNASRYVGEKFTRKTNPDDCLQSGTIVAVVRKRNVEKGKMLHYKLQDDNSSFVAYVPCKNVMTNSKKNIYKV
jgi:hypothetical protein